jgi:hypothetical protein
MNSGADKKLSHWMILILVLVVSSPALAQVLITQAKANSGNVTNGDDKGFPVTISQRGSYRLGSNLFINDANTTAIQITADNVTLDLNGFTIFGPNVCTGTGAGITCNANGPGRGIDTTHSNVTIINGTITGMGNAGVVTGVDSRIENVRAIGNGGDGLHPDGRSLVRNCLSTNNFESGISALGVGNAITGNTTDNNAYFGIQTGCPSNVIANTSTENGGGDVALNSAGCNSEHNLAPNVSIP